jgi:chaperonin cofactor prefoldin
MGKMEFRMENMERRMENMDGQLQTSIRSSSTCNEKYEQLRKILAARPPPSQRIGHPITANDVRS